MTTEKDLKPVDREFPKVKYQGTEKGAKCVTVRSAEEEAALGEGWLDGHGYWMAQRERDEATPEGEELPGATPIDEPRKRKGKA